MQVRGCRIEVLAIFDADQIRHLHRIEDAAVPARNRAPAGTRGEQPRKFSRCHGLQALVNIVLRPRDAERPVQPHAEGLVAHAERNRRVHDAIGLMDRHEQRSRTVLAARQPRSADDRGAVPQVGHVATGTIRKRKCDPLAGWHPAHCRDFTRRQARRARWIECIRVAGRRNPLGIERTQRQMIEFVEYAPPRGDPISFGPTCVRLDQRLRSDTLQHLPVAARLAVGHIHRIRPHVLSRQRVVFLRRHVRRAHVQAGDRRGPVSERRVIPRPWDVWVPSLRISAPRPQETSHEGEGRQQSGCESRLRAAHVRSVQGSARRSRILRRYPLTFGPPSQRLKCGANSCREHPIDGSDCPFSGSDLFVIFL